MYRRIRDVEHGRPNTLANGGPPKSLLQLKALLRECFGELEADGALCEGFTIPRLWADTPRKIMEHLYKDVETETSLHFSMLLNLLHGNDHAHPLLIMGKVGVGKSTLIKHLFQCTSKSEILPLPVFVDFKRANSQISDLSTFVNEQISSALSDALPSNTDESYVKSVLFVANPATERYLANLSDLDEHEGKIALQKALLRIQDDILLWNRSRIHYIHTRLERRVFLIFDNLDHHLSPTFISRVMTEARRQSESNECKLVITLRPQNLGIANEVGPYAAEPLPLVSVSGVDVRDMLKRRIALVTRSYSSLQLDSIVLSNGIRVRPDDFLKLLAIRFEMFLSEPVLVLLEGIVGSNYRKLLLAVRQVFTSRLLVQAEDIGRGALSKYDVLEALLRPSGGPYLSPETDPDALLINVFENEQPEQSGNNLIRIRVLQVLAYRGPKALHRQVVQDLSDLGYPRATSEAVLDLLRVHGLVEGGDHSEVLSSIDSYVYCYRLTETGSFYLSSLIHEFRYILAIREDILFSESVYPKMSGGNVTTDGRLEDRMRVVFAFDDYLAQLEDLESAAISAKDEIRTVFPRISLAMKESHGRAFDSLRGAAMKREQFRDGTNI